MLYNGFVLSGNDIVAKIENEKITPIIAKKMPLFLSRGGNFTTWLESRSIDRHRPNSRILKKVLRITDTSDVASVLHVNAATITDNFWVKEFDSPLLYDDVKFSENLFSEIALTGGVNSYNKDLTKEQLTSKTPELTNIGSYEKCWKIEDGTWYMYKYGSDLEIFSELFISKLANFLQFDSAEYIIQDSFIKTKDFTKGEYNFEPMASIVDDNEEYVFNYDKLLEIDESLAVQYLNILFMDTVCFNMDRHTYNYGLLREQTSGKIVKMAPNFDNNIALISRGYLKSAKNSSNLLIELWQELLNKRDIEYKAPLLKADDVFKIANCCNFNNEIDVQYIKDFIMDRYSRVVDF